MAVFIGSIKKKGAYMINKDPFYFRNAIEYNSNAVADGYDSFQTFAQAKKELIRNWTYSYEDYRDAIKFWRKQKSIPK